MIICLILLLLDLGPPALAGFAVFILASLFQTYALNRMSKLRRRSMLWTDKRSKLLLELLSGMKVIKFFAWENSFLERISGYRRPEME
jgi:ABC-type bacteriocin/lantibiotic exporter with double-glycine peptidase domain